MPVAPVLTVCDVAFEQDERLILRDIGFALTPGEWTMAMGPPGAGKTTLLRLVANACAPTHGAVMRAGAVAFAPNAATLDRDKTARDLVADAMGGATEQAAALLEDLGLGAYLAHEPFRLSRGCARRLEIAVALGAGPAVLCLDDPFSPLDRAARAATASVLRRAARARGLAVLMVCNDPADALRHADQIVALTPGPGATVAGLYRNAPRPGASDAALKRAPLYTTLENALWDQTR